MSEPHLPESPDAIVFRSAVPGRPSRLGRPGLGRPLFSPGRAYLEVAVVLAAFTLLAPALAPCALGSALLARRAGNVRWPAATAAAIWCLVLGVALRGALGLSLAP